jgi:hypothetical protein
MEEHIEKGPEKVPTREEVLEIISRSTEGSIFVRELSDENGLYLLETRKEGEKAGETIQYEYMRKGRYPDQGEASETAPHIVYYKSDVPVGGDKIAVYNSETSEWKNT